ncbi:MAG TPA: PadR family transcriptional regulator [Vicinamibacterales bacterium]|nr:PadR family transcriptional regulator [Vicinamibacterales bacterium]
MQKGERYTSRIDLLQGTLDFIILQTLRWGPQHGYGISQAINAHSHDAFKVETGSLYPALHRLEKRGWVASQWSTSENNQRVKIYTLTAPGRRQLTAEQSRWAQFVDAMASLMKPRDREA